MTFQIQENVATYQEYEDLCRAVGWENGINFKVAPKALAGSIYGVTVKHEERTVGMGRIVGDGAMYFYIQDVAVHPEFQRQGIGRQIISHLLNYIESHADGPVFVGLFATDQAVRLYETFGFSPGDMQGMFQVVIGVAENP